jgi:V/A-type H+-transporting ATPase subunit K
MSIILGIAILIVVFTIGLGVILYRTGAEHSCGKVKKLLKASMASYAALIILFLFVMLPKIVFAAPADSGSAGLATIGAGYAVGAVGSSALGAVSEDPKILGKTLIFVGLAEGIAIYGLIISIIILGQL